MYQSLYNRSWRVILANGEELAFTTGELYSFLKSRRLLIALALVFAILVSTDPQVFQNSLPILERSLFWLLAVTAYVALLIAGLVVVKLRNLRGADKAIVLPFVSVPALCLTTLLVIGFGIGALGAEPLGYGAGVTPFVLATSLIASQCFEFVIAKWIFADHLKDVRTGAEIPQSEPMLVTSSGSIPLSGILYLEAREHYVEIVQVNSQLKVRSTLSALTNQLPANAGFRVHRSFWVAKSSLQTMGNRHAQKELSVAGGRKIPIARSRQKEFHDWYMEHFR